MEHLSDFKPLERVARGGLSELPDAIADPARRVLADLKEIGAFLVPVGELEEWLADANIHESKENKWAWANAAALHVQRSSRRGRRFTGQNCSTTGTSCNPANRPSRSSHSGKAMRHPIHRVPGFSITGPYTLLVSFADGTEQQIDFQPVLHGALFGPLQDLATFNAVTLDLEAGTLVWPNDADFDPSTLHDWPNVCEELAARAREWTVPAVEQRPDTRMGPTRR
jgi:uncharacterized protein DUF2442